MDNQFEQQRLRELNRITSARYRDNHRQFYRDYQRQYQASELQQTKKHITSKTRQLLKLQQKITSLTGLLQTNYLIDRQYKRAVNSIARLQIELRQLNSTLIKLQSINHDSSI